MPTSFPERFLRHAAIASTFIVASTVTWGQPVQLTQVTPDIDPGADHRIVLEKVVDPNDDRNALVNFAFELENLTGTELELREMTFSYFDASSALIHQEIVSPDQIAELLIHPDVAAGVWSLSDQNTSQVNVDWATFQGTWQDLKQMGYRLKDIEVSSDTGIFLYSGLFERGSGPSAAIVGRPWSAFLPAWQGLEGQGQRMIDFETYLSTDGQTRLYTGLFEAATYSPTALIGQPWSDFHASWAQLESDGYRMFDFETHISSGGIRLYSGIFRPGSGGSGALILKNWDDFLTGWQDLEADGYRMIDFESDSSMSGAVYFGLFAPASYTPRAAIDRPWDNFLSTWKDLEDQGYRMFDLEQRPEAVNLYSGIFEPGPPVVWRTGAKILFMSPQGEFVGRTWPTEVRVRARFDNAADFVFELPIEVYLNKNSAQSYPFPALQSDLPRGRYWFLGSGGGHEGPRPSLPVDEDRMWGYHRGALWDVGGHFCFGQQYAWDLVVVGWDGQKWTTGNGGDQNSDRYIWGTPVYAVEDGEILYCYGSSDDNSIPGEKDSLVAGVPMGGNMYWIRHSGGEVALYAHLQKDSVPSSLCPTDGLQNPPVTVSKGQQLGLAGNSGNSGGPHLHFHIQDSWVPGDTGQSMPTLFHNIDVGRPITSVGLDWESANGAGMASGDESVLIEIDN